MRKLFTLLFDLALLAAVLVGCVVPVDNDPSNAEDSKTHRTSNTVVNITANEGIYGNIDKDIDKMTASEGLDYVLSDDGK